MNFRAMQLILPVSLCLLSCGSKSRGTVVFSSPAIQELEPNNNAFQPDSIGPVAYDSYYRIDGSIQEGFASDDYSAPSSGDQFDGFAFYVDDLVEIEFVLHATNPFADLDLWIYDPFYDEYIARFESVNSPEYGRVTFPYLGEEFHVVVTSYSGDSNYSLELIAHPLHALQASVVAAASSEEVPSDKSEARMRKYLKSEHAPQERAQIAAVVELDEKSGEVQTTQLVSSKE